MLNLEENITKTDERKEIQNNGLKTQNNSLKKT